MRAKRRKDAMGLVLIAVQIAAVVAYVCWGVHMDHVHGITVAQDLRNWGF